MPKFTVSYDGTITVTVDASDENEARKVTDDIIRDVNPDRSAGHPPVAQRSEGGPVFCRKEVNMEYWRGIIDWPLHPDWECPFCGQRALIWGLVHAQCRCVDCHVQFHMRDEQGQVVDRPICRLKPEYAEPFRRAWRALRIPVDQLTDEQWDAYFAKELQR